MKQAKDNFIETGAFIGGVFGLMLNIIDQSKKKKENPERKFDFQSFILIGVLGAIVGAVSFRILEFLISVFTSKEEILDEVDEINYLATVLVSYEPDEIDRAVLLKGKKIKSAIKAKFKNDLLGKVKYQGSVDQGTALSGLSDLDLLVQFKKTSFQKESDMYYALYNFFKYNFKDEGLVDIRKQKSSVGLIYNIDNSKEIIDVVPTLRTDFIRGKHDYTLFKNPNLSTGAKKVKMNPYKQKDFGGYQNQKIDIIRLIKILKVEEKLPLKSVLIKELTKKAFQDVKMPVKLNQKLIKVLEYIRDNIQKIKVSAPDNPRVDLTNDLTYSEKTEIKKALDVILCNLKKDKNYLLDYFPEK